MKIRSDSNAKFIYRRRAVAVVFKTQNDMNGINYWSLRVIRYFEVYTINLFMHKWHLLIHKDYNGKMFAECYVFWSDVRE